MSDLTGKQAVAACAPLVEGLWLNLKRLGAAGSQIILAASGGADSTALVLAAAQVAPRLGLSLAVATVDHGLRPGSAAEVDGVRSLAGELSLRFESRALALAPGPGLEQRARVARYAALDEVRRQLGFAFIATAHTATDQAETVLMRLGRGAALKGAASILERRGALLRPLLFATRGEVRQWLSAQARAWVEDPMNDDEAFLRVRVRQRLLPALEEAFDAGVTRRLAQFAALAADDEALLAELADQAFERMRQPDGNLAAQALREAPAPLARRCLARYLSERGVRLDHALVNDALAAVAAGKSQTLPRDLVLATRAGVVRVEPSAPRSTK